MADETGAHMALRAMLNIHTEQYPEEEQIDGILVTALRNLLAEYDALREELRQSREEAAQYAQDIVGMKHNLDNARRGLAADQRLIDLLEAKVQRVREDARRETWEAALAEVQEALDVARTPGVFDGADLGPAIAILRALRAEMVAARNAASVAAPDPQPDPVANIPHLRPGRCAEARALLADPERYVGADAREIIQRLADTVEADHAETVMFCDSDDAVTCGACGSIIDVDRASELDWRYCPYCGKRVTAVKARGGKT